MSGAAARIRLEHIVATEVDVSEDRLPELEALALAAGLRMIQREEVDRWGTYPRLMFSSVTAQSPLVGEPSPLPATPPACVIAVEARDKQPRIGLRARAQHLLTRTTTDCFGLPTPGPKG